MNLTELATREKELYSIVISLGGNMIEKEKELEKQGIFAAYCKIYQEYARLREQSLEALKRGVFLSWYSTIESPSFSGIREVDVTAEHEVIKTLDNRLKQKKTDYELEWMLSHYATFDSAFDRFNEYKSLQERLKSKSVEMPGYINKNEMSIRGQMGVYWNFLYFFG